MTEWLQNPEIPSKFPVSSPPDFSFLVKETPAPLRRGFSIGAGDVKRVDLLWLLGELGVAACNYPAFELQSATPRRRMHHKRAVHAPSPLLLQRGQSLYAMRW